MAYASSKFANGEMRSSIFSTLASDLEIFVDAGVARMTGGKDIDFRKLIDPDKPCAIFMVVPDNKKTRYISAMRNYWSIPISIRVKCSLQRVRYILDELGCRLTTGRQTAKNEFAKNY